MAPPALLRTRSFATAWGVYLLAYLAFSGFIYYVTLYFQNVQAVVRASYRTVVVAVLHSLFRGGAAQASAGALAAGGHGGRLGMRDRGRGHALA